MERWEKKRILVIGMTYPSYSNKYSENACTGGIEEGTNRMVRIHPVPARYLDERFKSFQWITAKVQKHESDPRPESLRVEPGSIELGAEISSKDVDERRKYLERSPHLICSVEELKERNDADGTSLGIIRPKEITNVAITMRSKAERAEWAAKERALMAQTTLPFQRPPKKIDFPEAEFRVSWRCDDARCDGHNMNLQQWGLHELYRKLAHDPERDDKVKDEMRKRLDLKRKDVFLFLGSFRSKLFNFGLMDSFSVKRRQQLLLGI